MVAPGNVALLTIEFLHFAALFVLLLLIQARLQRAHRSGLILYLRAVILTGHHDTTRHMRQAHSRFGSIDVLPPFATGSIDVGPNIGGIDFDIRIVLDFRNHIDRRKRGMASRIGIKRTDADQTVNPALCFGIAKRIRAGDPNSRCRDAHFFTRRNVEHFDAIARLLRPTRIHAQEHIGPIARLGAACARMYRQQRIAGVVWTTQKRRQLQGIELRLKALDSINHLLLIRLRIRIARTLIHQLQHSCKVIKLASKSLGRIDRGLHAIRFADHFLRRFLVIPKTGFDHFGLQIANQFRLGISVKDTSKYGRHGA